MTYALVGAQMIEVPSAVPQAVEPEVGALLDGQIRVHPRIGQTVFSRQDWEDLAMGKSGMNEGQYLPSFLQFELL